MAISDREFNEWLEEHSAIRCVLMEVDCNSNGQEITRYFSSKAFLNYEPIISDGVNFKESLNLESSKAGLSFGGVSLKNNDQSYTHLLDDIWVKRKIILLIGDVTWERADFRVIFNGITEDIKSSNLTTLFISVRDKMQRLNYPLSEAKLDDRTINNETLLPMLFGECFNVTPILVDPSEHEYMLHNGKMEGIIEARDDDVPVNVQKLLHKGTCLLSNNSFGAITASGQGDSSDGYKNTVSRLVEHIVTRYGKDGERFESSDIDHQSFEKFEAENPQAVGLFINDRVNVITGITMLADSLGAQVIPSRSGLLRIIKIRAPLAGNAPIINDEVNLVTNTGNTLVGTNGNTLLSTHSNETRVLTEHDIVERGISISKRVPVRSSIKIGYCKNYTVQKEVTTGIPQNHKELYSNEWLSKLATDNAVSLLYKIDTQPVQKDTLLVNGDDAQAEADRLLSIFSVQRSVFKIKGFINLVYIELGDDIILKFNKFGLDNGKYGVVLSIDVDWIAMRVTLEVLV